MKPIRKCGAKLCVTAINNDNYSKIITLFKDNVVTKFGRILWLLVLNVSAGRKDFLPKWN